MDKTSKKIIKYLKETPDKILLYHEEPYKKLNIEENEFFRCIRYLEKNGMVEFINNQNGIHLGAALTHIAIHEKSIKWDSFKNWFLSSFLGGIITGVTSTLLVELLLYLGAKLLALI